MKLIGRCVWTAIDVCVCRLRAYVHIYIRCCLIIGIIRNEHTCDIACWRGRCLSQDYCIVTLRCMIQKSRRWDVGRGFNVTCERSFNVTCERGCGALWSRQWCPSWHQAGNRKLFCISHSSPLHWVNGLFYLSERLSMVRLPRPLWVWCSGMEAVVLLAEPRCHPVQWGLRVTEEIQSSNLRWAESQRGP